MKRLLAYLLIMWLNLHLAGASPDPSTYMKMSAEEAAVFLAGPSAGPVEQNAFIAEALATDNHALLQVCLTNLDTRYDLLERIETIPGVSRKESLLLLLLRTDAGWWPSPNFVQFGSQFPTPLEGALGQMIRKYFPDLELGNRLVHTLDARTKLAADLEQAINRTASPALNTSVSQRVTKPDVVDDPAGSTVVSRQNAGQDKTPITPTQYLLWTLAVLAGLGAVAFVIKRKSE